MPVDQQSHRSLLRSSSTFPGWHVGLISSVVLVKLKVYPIPLLTRNGKAFTHHSLIRCPAILKERSPWR